MSFNQARNHFLVGLSLMSSERWADAEVEFRHSLDLLPGRASTLTNLSACLIKQDKLLEAEFFVDEALALEHDNPEALLNHGVFCFKMGRTSEAEQSFLAALALRPDSAEILTNLGSLVIEDGRVEEACGHYRRALEINPDYAEAHNSYGVALSSIAQYDRALECFDRAVKLRPSFHVAWTNRGVVLHDLQRFSESLQSYKLALSICPSYSQALYNQGILHLSLKSFQLGFQLCSHRWNSEGFKRKELNLKIPVCSPSDLIGGRSRMKRILLWAEQGIGDEIFYAGFLRLLPKGGAVFALSVDHRLMPIFARSFPGIKLIERRLVPTIQDDHFDLQAPIGDLGTLLGVSESGVAEIANAPYLIPNLRRCDRLLEDLPSLREGPVCGLAWRSSGSRFSRQKSVDLKSFGHALRSLPHQFVNLQYGDVEGDLQELGRAASRPILVAPDLDVYNDIDGLLSLISLCDVVITCSNVTAHLAGSIGKRAAVILPFGRGRLWYWHEHDDFSPWYPQLRLCRQQADLDWLTPIDEGCSWILESRGNYDRTS